jgi:DNA-binding IclR family transcriptional regulator
MIQSIENNLDILARFSHDTPEIGVADIANKLCLCKGTVLRLLSTRQQGNLVVQIPPYQKYRLAPKILELASIFLSHLGWRMIAIPHLKDLRDNADETVTVFIIEGNERICIEKFDSSHGIRPVLNLGGRYPHPCRSGREVAFGLPLTRDAQRNSIPDGSSPAYSSHDYHPQGDRA